MRQDAANPLVSAAHDDDWYRMPTSWRRAWRLAYDRAALALVGTGRQSGVRRLGRIGELLHACGLQEPSWQDVAKLFPDLSPRDAPRVARQIAALRFKNRAAIASFYTHGLVRLARLVSDECAAAPPPIIANRSGGLILVSFHIGAEFGVAAAAVRWGVVVSALRVLPGDEANVRSRHLKHAIDTVRAGGVISAAVDGPGGASCAPVRCLGRQILLRRGPLAIARLTGAPVVPVVAQWTREGRIVARAGEALATSRGGGTDEEDSLAASAAHWLEQRLLASPADIWPYTLRNLLGAPLSAGEVGRTQEVGVANQRA